MIVAWEEDDRPLLEASLGPKAKASLRSLVEGRTWEGLRADLSGGSIDNDFALGYRFDVPSIWSIPEVATEVFHGRNAGERS